MRKSLQFAIIAAIAVIAGCSEKPEELKAEFQQPPPADSKGPKGKGQPIVEAAEGGGKQSESSGR